MNPRKLLAILVGKAIIYLTRTLKLGGGSAAPGLYALKIYPNLIEDLIKNIPQNVVITGTNGKTTTVKMLAHLVQNQNLKIIRNHTGSNLERGIASALIQNLAFNLSGCRLNFDVGIWELDEAAFNKLVFKIKPNVIVFLNAFRDQLDRYGEVDSIIKKWRESLANIDWQAKVLLNSGDANTWTLKGVKNDSYEFRVKNHIVYGEKAVNVSTQKHQDHFSATVLKNLGLLGSEIEVKTPQKSFKVKFPVPGIYHIYDFLAALGAYQLLGLPAQNLQQLVNTFSPAFGRVEQLEIAGHKAYVFLIKNPAGATAVFETIAPEINSNDRLLLALNDNYADGTDVSWIWDSSFELLPVTCHLLPVSCSGTRAEDMAVRLKYAGFDPKFITVHDNLEKALKEATEALKGRLFILPTYTALLSFQKLFTRLGIKKHYWKE